MGGDCQYADCKHCGKSVMEGEIHSCKRMYLAEIEGLRKEVEQYKSGMKIWMEAAGDIREQLESVEGVVDHLIKKSGYWRDKYMEVSGCKEMMPPTLAE